MNEDSANPYAIDAPVVPVKTPEAQFTSGLTPSARRVFDELLEIGAARPVMVSDLAERLRSKIAEGTAEACATWTERGLYLSKSTIATVLRCEGQAAGDAHTPKDGERKLIPSVVVGQVSHVAVQLSYTHPGRGVHTYVQEALEAQIAREDGFANSWRGLSMVNQSDMQTQMVSRTTSFLDNFPPLRPEWNPRFEESIVAKLGKLALASRPDLVMGRPRADLTQTLLICDFKTGSIREEHEDEADFYALVATLRNGVAPYKSFVYSLASGDYTSAAPVTEEILLKAADRVIMATNAYVAVLSEKRDAALAPGMWCSWCPLAATCPVSAAGIK